MHILVVVGVSISALIVNLGGVDVKVSHAYMWPAINEKRAVFRISLRPSVEKEKKISVFPYVAFKISTCMYKFRLTIVWSWDSLSGRARLISPGLQKCH